MKTSEKTNGSEILRLLPSVDGLLQTEAAQHILHEAGAKRLTDLARKTLELLRSDLRQTENFREISRESVLTAAENKLAEIYEKSESRKLRRVINATGVIIHTNLGRAPLAEKVRQAMLEESSRYCSLEYDIETGKRARRGAQAEKLLAEITDAEAALIVNNCAAACVLVLTALAQGGEAVLSRGEMVEIGGDFRIPDVLAQSGAILREVGTTNRTKISDYEKVVNENTRLILKVHPSNYKIVGFTATPTVKELSQIARNHNILLYEDAGSGALIDLSPFGLAEEPVISESIKAGADVVTFSGDKLTGSVQAGLIAGKSEVIEKLRKHPLYRALRVGKQTYAALEAAFEIFRRETFFQEIPVLKMLAASTEDMKNRTLDFAEKFRRALAKNDFLKFEIVEGDSAVGGGAAPNVPLKTTLIAIRHEKFSAAEVEKKLRLSEPPIIARIADDKVLLDLRTVFEDEESELLKIPAILR